MEAMAILLALAAAASWGIAMTIAKPILRYMDPLTFLLVRWGIALVPAVSYALLTHTLVFPDWTAIGYVALASLLNVIIGWTIYMLANLRAPAYQSATLASTAPLWGVVAAIVFLGDPLRWQVLVAGLLVVGGAIFLVQPKALSLRSSGSGAALAVLAGIFWGISETVPTKLAIQHGITSETMLVVLGCVTLLGMSLLTPLLRKRVPRRFNPKGLWLVVLSAISGAFLGWFFWLQGLRLADASVLAPVRGSTLLFTFVFSVIFLRERPSRWAVAGVLLVFGGVMLVSFSG
jgi:drug/metabolite transporter (DMT)-like permease